MTEKDFKNSDGETEDVLEYIAASNKSDYNLTKTVEELNELATAISQLHNKPYKSEKYLKNINEEIADVEVRIALLKLTIVDPKEVQKCVEAKIAKFFGYIKEDKYIGKI